MKSILAGMAAIVSVCLVSQSASGFVMVPSTSFVALSGCDSGYLVKDCKSKATITRVKSYSVNLKESLEIDSGDKKQEAKTKEKKPAAKKDKSSKYKLCNKYKDNAKKFNACKKLIDKKLDKKSKKTKRDTAKNSIGNIR
ncbi:MAG: hypothetical protein WAO91_10750 [Candidatus Nitrosotenuis sp.]